MVWKKGQSGNPKGRAHENEFAELFKEALIVVEEEKKESIMQRAVRRAYVNDKVLIEVLRKIVPDKIESTNYDVSKEELNTELLGFINDIRERIIARPGVIKPAIQDGQSDAGADGATQNKSMQGTY